MAPFRLTGKLGGTAKERLLKLTLAGNAGGSELSFTGQMHGDWNNLPENARREMKANGFENWFAYAYYAHLSELSVAEGDNVVAGQELGKLGNTGNTNFPHLHLEVRVAKTNKNDVAFPTGATTADRYRRINPAAMFNV